MAQSEAVKAKMAAIQQDYLNRLPERLAELDALWQAVVVAQWGAESVAAMRQNLHKLAGSGAIFGLYALSNQARALEQLCDAVLDAGGLDGLDELTAQGGVQLAQIRQAAMAGPRAGGAGVSLDRPPAVLYLLAENPSLAAQLRPHFSHFGLKFEQIAQVDVLLARLAQEPAAALLVEQPLLPALHARLSGEAPPILCLAERDDLESRLAAVAMGGRAFVPQPLDLGQLLERLDSLLEQHDRRPYKVAILTYSAPLGAYYRQLLRSEGLEVCLLQRAAGVLERLGEFLPELILLDTQLPDADGSLLGEVIRQHPQFVGVPLIFLIRPEEASSPPHRDYHSGDKLLSKPVPPELLVRAVRHRVERARLVRGQLLHDGLTGLLNHSAASEALLAELKRARRNQTQLAYVMLDLDHFKRVNDLHGHAVGDQVLRTIARLLRQRLRGSDLIGRYGGEEFAVVLPDIDAEGAAEVVNELREDFAAIEQQSDCGAFHVTFSAGVAMFPLFADAQALGVAADKALYAAKHAGRNRVMLAHPDAPETDITQAEAP